MQFVHSDRVFPEAAAWAGELAELRHAIHMNPELRFDTQQTVERTAGLLRGWGIDTVDTEIVPGGLIATVSGNRPGKTIAFRADIDALPMDDASDTDWKSRVPGKAHTCGHDGHLTWLAGALRYLALHRDFPGRFVGIFQPAEEIAKGALAVVEAGVLEKYEVCEIYGAHIDPLIDKGTFGFHPGPAQASCSKFGIHLHGRGTHGARPHLGIDPIPVGCQIVSALQTVISRKLNPLEPAVLSVCSINAGSYAGMNIVPSELTISGTVRTYSPEVEEMIIAEMKRIIQSTAEAGACKAEFEYVRLCSALINSEEQTEVARSAAASLFGEGCIRQMPQVMGSEDYSEYLTKVPGTFFRVGGVDESHPYSNHHQKFDFNDEVLPAAVTLIATIATTRLRALAA